MYTVICTSVLETRTAPDQSLTYEVVVHPVCVESHCALSYGIRIYNDTRFAEQMDLTLSKREILEFLNLLARNTAQPEELHDRDPEGSVFCGAAFRHPAYGHYRRQQSLWQLSHLRRFCARQSCL